MFTVVSRHGAWLLPGLAVTNVDGSRVAAQIVSGIGFLGAGLIFVGRDAVRGLTTAASIWFVAAVGMACGAGVVDLAVTATILYLVVMFAVRPFQRVLPHSRQSHQTLTVVYADGRGILRDVMTMIGAHGTAVDNLAVVRAEAGPDGEPRQRVRFDLHMLGQSITDLVRELAVIEGVYDVQFQRTRHENG